jgi:Protein of unknown function (DUF3515)
VAVLTGLALFAVRGGFDGGTAAPSPSAAPSATPTARATGPVAVTPPPSGSPTTTAVCAALRKALPATLAGRPARPVTAERVAAWGDPPVVLRCGVRPVPVPPDTNKQFEINGVRWFAQAHGSVVVFTTTDRTVPVEVTVPAISGNPADVPAELAGPVSKAVPAAR